MEKQKVVIIGAGPAGVSAAHELSKSENFEIIIVEAGDRVGGISRTVEHDARRIDIGPHRFFTKSERVQRLWDEILPRQGMPAKDDLALGRKIPLAEGGPDPERSDAVSLYRKRLTRIYFLRRLFPYPISFGLKTLRNLGLRRIAKIGLSYIYAALFPRPENNLEDFYINRFGQELYETFFRGYTKKVWGCDCSEIPKDWGAQRVKKLSVVVIIKDLLADALKLKKEVQTSLIDSFYYPKFGAGQMYEAIADEAISRGAELFLNTAVTGLIAEDGKIKAARIRKPAGEIEEIRADHFISSMPISELIAGIDGLEIPGDARSVAQRLSYRDYIQVGLLFDRMKLKNETGEPTLNSLIPDNWIYIQERDVLMGRLDIFNNFSPYMLPDMAKVWLGCEYFCDESDSIWNMADADLADFAAGELRKMSLIGDDPILGFAVIRQKKAYPSYFGAYKDFSRVREFTDTISNLYLIGRNGMHKYNNMDHSILTGLIAADNIKAGRTGKDNLWSVNTEVQYHESKG